MKKSIIRNEVKKLVKDKPVRMHMPGHKGRRQRYKYDITEIVGADNLHDPKGIIREAQDKAAEIYGAEETIFLVGGSTAGIQASILAALEENDKILIPINSHRAVYPALGFAKANPIFYKPIELEHGRIVTPEIVEKLVEEHPDAKAMLVVSPDFYGNISDLKSIKEILDKKDIRLIVDEAHGAHLRFMPEKLDAISAGADYVIQSTHKLLGAPTQASVLHLGNKANIRRVKKLLPMLESSSPSYILMVGIEDAIDEANEKAKKIFTKINKAHRALEKEQNEDDPIQLITPNTPYDRSKFVYSVPNASEIQKKLIEELRIIPELISGNTIIFMTGIGTTQKDLNRLFGAIKILNEDLKDKGIKPEAKKSSVDHLIKPYNLGKPLYEVMGKVGKRIPIGEAENKIILDFIIPYPPGIPLLIPGSIISKEDIENINYLIEKDYIVNGLDIENNQVFVEVLDEES